MKYVFEGPVPVADEAGELVHPLDVREFDSPPDCPPWRLLEEPQAEEPPPPDDDPEADPAAPAKAPSAARAAKTEGK